VDSALNGPPCSNIASACSKSSPDIPLLFDQLLVAV